MSHEINWWPNLHIWFALTGALDHNRCQALKASLIGEEREGIYKKDSHSIDDYTVKNRPTSSEEIWPLIQIYFLLPLSNANLKDVTGSYAG